MCNRTRYRHLCINYQQRRNLVVIPRCRSRNELLFWCRDYKKNSAV
uniref:Uncharacterized protein n=1 Tax=Octopus bimaculoides TaxID=37653 RepID=A0A0L8IAL7_OCTBM